jgi:hypothetical protein
LFLEDGWEEGREGGRKEGQDGSVGELDTLNRKDGTFFLLSPMHLFIDFLPWRTSMAFTGGSMSGIEGGGAAATAAAAAAAGIVVMVGRREVGSGGEGKSVVLAAPGAGAAMLVVGVARARRRSSGRRRRGHGHRKEEGRGGRLLKVIWLVEPQEPLDPRINSACLSACVCVLCVRLCVRHVSAPVWRW